IVARVLYPWGVSGVPAVPVAEDRGSVAEDAQDALRRRLGNRGLEAGDRPAEAFPGGPEVRPGHVGDEQPGRDRSHRRAMLPVEAGGPAATEGLEVVDERRPA